MLMLNSCFINICFYLAFFSARREILIAVALVVAWLYRNLTCRSNLLLLGYAKKHFNKRRSVTNVRNSTFQKKLPYTKQSKGKTD